MEGVVNQGSRMEGGGRMRSGMNCGHGERIQWSKILAEGALGQETWVSHPHYDKLMQGYVTCPCNKAVLSSEMAFTHEGFFWNRNIHGIQQNLWLMAHKRILRGMKAFEDGWSWRYPIAANSAP